MAYQEEGRDYGEWQGVSYKEGASGAPLLEGTVAVFECFNRSRYDEGDHVIFVGEVVTYDAPGGPPLVFHDGRYIARATEEPLPKGFGKPWR